MTARYGFALLAPLDAGLNRNTLDRGTPMDTDPLRYHTLLSEMQKLRGTTYLADGAISQSDLDAAGRFRLSDDSEAWHLLLTDPLNEVIGCVRLRRYSANVPFEELRVSHSALSKDPEQGPRVRRAIESDLQLARENGLCYVEIGGWAIKPEWRNTKAALDILAGSYALGELWGGSLGVATATVRHGSASILRRMGGSSLQADGEALPPYFDPTYGCEMELLRFTRTPAQRFAALVAPLQRTLGSIQPVRAYAARPRLQVPARVLSAEVA